MSKKFSLCDETIENSLLEPNEDGHLPNFFRVYNLSFEEALDSMTEEDWAMLTEE